MRMIFTILFLISTNVLAGNGSGTMARISPEELIKNLFAERTQYGHIVFDLGSTTQKLNFAHAKHDGQKWVITKIELLENEMFNSELEMALKESSDFHKWIEFKH